MALIVNSPSPVQTNPTGGHRGGPGWAGAGGPGLPPLGVSSLGDPRSEPSW